MNIIILGVRIIEDSDNRGSDNRGCTVYMDTTVDHFTPLAHCKDFSLERCQSSQYAAETAILVLCQHSGQDCTTMKHSKS